MRGAWVGFSWGHTQAHFFRAVLESVAFEYAYYLRILRDLIPDLELDRDSRGGRRGAQPRLEPNQGRCPGRALPALEAQRVWHMGQRHDRGTRCRAFSLTWPRLRMPVRKQMVPAVSPRPDVQ